jgi:hypothetical protein
MNSIKNVLTILVCSVILLSCHNQKNAKSRSVADASTTDSILCEEPEAEAVEFGETMNDIRFDGWGKKEWADNEYIRAVRKHIDAYLNGEIKDSYLDEYKDYIKGKFVIGDIKPGLWGGAFMYIVFFNNPEKTFSVLVQSEVDVETRTISNYECYGLKMEDFDLGFSQEDIKQFLKECPEHKMW